VDFDFTSEQRLLRQKCLELAADFAARSAAHAAKPATPSRITKGCATRVFLR
jgi:hypothetical protein